MRVPSETAMQFREDFIKSYPKHEEEVTGLYELLCDEIQDSDNSQEHEEELFYSSCNDLLLEQ